jgi:hypothetical protein
MTMFDPPHLLGRSAQELAARNRMKPEGEVEYFPGVEATTANFDLVQGAPQKHLFPSRIETSNSVTITTKNTSKLSP